jgi:hypothetical protein
MQGIAWCGENFPVNIWPLFAAAVEPLDSSIHVRDYGAAGSIWRKSIRIERHGPGQTLIVPQENF